MAREPMPSAIAPLALPVAMSGRMRLAPSDRSSATTAPPASSTAMVSGFSFMSVPLSNAAAMIRRACSSFSVMAFPSAFRNQRAAGSQPVDLPGRIADLGEDFGIVLAEPRRRPDDATGRCRKLDRQADRLHRPGLRVLGLDHHLARQRLRITVHLGDVEH